MFVFVNAHLISNSVPSRLIQQSDAKEFATAYNIYFAIICKKLAANIYDNDNTFDDFQQYLNTPAEARLRFNCITKNRSNVKLDAHVHSITNFEDVCLADAIMELCEARDSRLT